MSTRIESYIIYGLKFGKEFTEDFWKKDFYDHDKEAWEEKNQKTNLILLQTE